MFPMNTRKCLLNLAKVTSVPTSVSCSGPSAQKHRDTLLLTPHSSLWLISRTIQLLNLEIDHYQSWLITMDNNIFYEFVQSSLGVIQADITISCDSFPNDPYHGILHRFSTPLSCTMSTFLLSYSVWSQDLVPAHHQKKSDPIGV